MKKNAILLIALGLFSFFIVFLITISIAGLIFIGEKNGENRNAKIEDEIPEMIAIKINGSYDGKKGKLTLTGDSLKITGIVGTGNKKGFTAKTKSGKKGKIVKAEYTAFGPPWNKMEGGGKNAVDASSQEKDLKSGKLVCAAPKSVPFWTKITVLETKTKEDGRVYTVKDRGGAIIQSGSLYHIDLLMKTRTQQNRFGRRSGKAIIGGSQNAKLKIHISQKGKVTITGEANAKNLKTEGTYKDGKITTSGWLGNGFGSKVGLEGMVSFALKIAKGKNSHGYSQANRTCQFCNKNASPDYDCSSLVTAALAHSNMGEDFKKACRSWAYSTRNIGDALEKNGWANLGALNISKCKRGDILLAPGYHVEIYCGSNILVGAHQDRDGKTGESSDNEIYYQNYSGKWWKQVYRYKGKVRK